eukprot:m.17666 g.17666  ORF g.17666 m.17666 type:complete len:225 (-) comp8181_c0_seq3:183-857(-)
MFSTSSVSVVLSRCCCAVRGTHTVPLSTRRALCSTPVASTLWRNWMNHVWNRKDESRLKLIGPDRLACEWALRMGGRVQVLRGSGDDAPNKKWYTDYNFLPWLQVTDKKQLPDVPVFVYEVDLSDAADTQDPGLLHLEGLLKLEILSLRNCPEITDSALKTISTCPALKHLDVCGTNVTEEGVNYFLSHNNSSVLEAVVVDQSILISNDKNKDPRIKAEIDVEQ